jgi:hypothetical protein
MDSIDVWHPIFGLVPRAGWAGMKKGMEVAFTVLRKDYITNEKRET